MKVPLLTTLIPGTFALSLLQVLQATPELSTLYKYINASPDSTAFLANSNNFTFLAPSNDAISSFVQSQGNATLTADLILASLQYGTLKGGYPTLSFSNSSQFAASSLSNPGYSNVTGGQVVELKVDGSGNPQVISGNKTTANVADELICMGGIVHVIDKFLSIPTQAVLQISAANMQYFVSILNTAGYLNAGKADYVDGVMKLPDVTYFIPNSAAALAKATIQAGNSTAEELKAVFQYHVVPGFLGYSNVLKDGMKLKTQEGTELTITIQDGNTYVNSAKVVASDFVVANGVVHVIDNLLDRFDDAPPQKNSSDSSLTTSSTTSTNSPTTSDSNPVPNSADNSLSDKKVSSSSSGLPTSTVIAIGVASGAGGLTLLVFIVVFLIRKRKQNQKSKGKPDILSIRGSAPSQMESLYVQGGTIHKKDDGYATEYRVERSGSGLSGSGGGKEKNRISVASVMPEIPARSPGRALRRETSSASTGESFF